MLAVFLAGTLVAWTALAGSGGQALDADPAPFDPLSAEESSRAMNLTLANASLDAELSDRVEAIGAAVHTDKSFEAMETWPRMAEVWVYDYDANLAVRAHVDLDAGDLASWEMLDVQPPLTVGEIDRAGTLALAEEAVRDRLVEMGFAPDDVGWTARLWTGPSEDACPEHRCALVAFEKGTAYIHEFAVLVDLVDPSVREVQDHDEEGGHR